MNLLMKNNYAFSKTYKISFYVSDFIDSVLPQDFDGNLFWKQEFSVDTYIL